MDVCIYFRSARGKVNQSQYRYRIAKALEGLDAYFFKHPALQFTLLFLIGTSFTFKTILPALILWFLCRYKDKLLLSFFISLLGFINFNLNSTSLLEADSPKNGIGLFRIESVRSSLKGLYLYKGKFIKFHSDKATYRNIFCTIAFRGKNRPLASYDYLIEGTLTNKSNRFISFKPKKRLLWVKHAKKLTLNETRFKLKKKLKSLFSKKIKASLSRSLITSLVTGEVDNKLLRFSFARLGLSHVLAISGFHFALVISFFSFFLIKVLPQKLFLIVLIIISLAYFLFIGMTPSVFRACALVIMYIFAKLLKKDAFAMNLMGVSILLNLVLIPTDLYHLGFQLSYLSYSAIIIFYPILYNYFKNIIRDHNDNDFSILTKIVYKILRYFRGAISLNLAISFTLFPVLIFYFSTFPIYSLIYNLFIPLLISLLLNLTIIALLLPFLFYVVNIFSNLLIRVILCPPTICEYTLRYNNLSLNILLMFLIFIFLYGIINQTKAD